MENEVCVVRLPGIRNFALVSSGRIVFGLNTNREELNLLMSEEKTLILKQGEKEEGINQEQRDAIGIIPTFDCDLRCIYCYAGGGDTKEVIPLEIAVAAIKSVKRNGNSDYLNLYLVGGGEPLMYLERVKQIIEFANSFYNRVDIHVVTNGTFGPEVLNWLKKQNSHVRVSYDGVMQDGQRPFADGSSTREKVRANIKKLVAENIPVIIQCIITDKGIGKMLEITDEIVELGVKTIKFEPMLATAVSRGRRNLEPNPVKYADALLETIVHTAQLGRDLKIDTGYFSEPSTGFYCGMSKFNKIITPDGLVTSCVEVARKADPFADLVTIGEVDCSGIKIGKRNKRFLSILHFSNELGGCKKCNLRLVCHGGCPMANLWRCGLPYKKSDFTCRVEHEFLPKILLQIAENPSVADVVTDDTEVKFC